MAEERSGHCAVVDGNFLYVWGGYVVRREEAGGGGRRALGGEDEPGREAEGGRGKPRGGAARRRTGGSRAEEPGDGKRNGGGSPAALPRPASPPTAPSASAAPRRARSRALFTSARALIGCRGSTSRRGGRFKWRRPRARRAGGAAPAAALRRKARPGRGLLRVLLPSHLFVLFSKHGCPWPAPMAACCSVFSCLYHGAHAGEGPVEPVCFPCPTDVWFLCALGVLL